MVTIASLLSCTVYATERENPIDSNYGKSTQIDKTEFWKNPVKSKVIIRNGMNYAGFMIDIGSISCQYDYEDSAGNKGSSITNFNEVLHPPQIKNLFSESAFCVKQVMCTIIVKEPANPRQPLYGMGQADENSCQIQTPLSIF
jgi:hypothetical protein